MKSHDVFDHEGNKVGTVENSEFKSEGYTPHEFPVYNRFNEHIGYVVGNLFNPLNGGCQVLILAAFFALGGLLWAGFNAIVIPIGGVITAPLWAPIVYILTFTERFNGKEAKVRRTRLYCIVNLLLSGAIYTVLIFVITAFASKILPVCNMINVDQSSNTISVENNSTYTIDTVQIWMASESGFFLKPALNLYKSMNPGEVSSYTYSSRPFTIGVMHIVAHNNSERLEGPCFYS